MTIFVLTKGEYSDYRITGVFSSKELAEAAKAKMTEGKDNYHAGYNDLEEYELDELGKDNRWMYFVAMQGERIDVHITDILMIYNINEVRRIEFNNKPVRYITNVMAEDAEHAVKIASDLIAQFKALQS